VPTHNPPSPRVVIEIPQAASSLPKPPSPRVVIKSRAAPIEAAGLPDAQVKPQAEDKTKLPKPNATKAHRRKKRKERRRQTAATMAQARQQAPGSLVTNVTVSVGRRSFGTVVPVESFDTRCDGPNIEMMDISTDIVMPVANQSQPRRKKKKTKMFLGANGPVYSTSIFDGPAEEPPWR